ncbi:hypothetical protein ACHAW5_008625 [Stephanodiscus triporus]|uniref:Uncharacterized protein n=1 Tax=Stephanodiscus triporus TaxID=2934178 RepID=A0ABD3QET3_9STRA
MKAAIAYEHDDDDDDAVVLANSRSVPVLYVNGRAVPPSVASRARPNQTLLDFLRNDLGLSGTKLGGGAGRAPSSSAAACAVVVIANGGTGAGMAGAAYRTSP